MEMIGKITGFLFPIFSIHFHSALDDWQQLETLCGMGSA